MKADITFNVHAIGAESFAKICDEAAEQIAVVGRAAKRQRRERVWRAVLYVFLGFVLGLMVSAT